MSARAALENRPVTIDLAALWLVLVGIWPLPIADLLTPVGLLDLAAHATGWLILHHRWRIVRRRNQWTVTWTTSAGTSTVTTTSEQLADDLYRMALTEGQPASIERRHS